MKGISRLTVRNFGTICSADIMLGDLTFLHGVHTSDKNVLPRLIKLIVDRNYILHQLYYHGLRWEGLGGLLQLYFGIGMNTLYEQKTRVLLDNQEVDFSDFWQYRTEEKLSEKVFYIPDQREYTIAHGITRPFMDFQLGTAFVVRQWGYILHSVVIPSMYPSDDEWVLFPRDESFQKLVSELAIGENVSVKMPTIDMARTLVLDRSGQMLRFAVWSAGQREFVPMLLGLFWLTSGKKRNYKYVFIEEPEKGISRSGIIAMSALILQLINSGYRVFITTSDTRMLYLASAIEFAKREECDYKGLLNILQLPDDNQIWLQLASKALEARIGVYELQGGAVVDIMQALPPLESFCQTGKCSTFR